MTRSYYIYDIRLLTTETRRLKTTGDHERKHICGRANLEIMSIFNPGKKGEPGGGKVESDTPKRGLQVFISPFCLAIGLEMIA